MRSDKSTSNAGSAGAAKVEPLGGSWHCTSMPAEFQDHSLVRDRFFFTLPRPLLDSVQHLLPTDGQLLELEYALSGICGDHTHRVGFWHNNPILFAHLRRVGVDKLAISETDLKTLGWDIDPQQLSETFKTAEQRLEPFATVAKGYAGWLMLHPPFLDDQNRLLAKWDREINFWGFPQLGQATLGPIPPEFKAISDDRLKAFADEFVQFLIYWRLAGLAAPNLPVPLTPQMPVPAPIFAMGPMSNVGAILYVPDTYPVPTRDALRRILEDSLRGDGGPGHLKDWTGIVRSNNAAKNQIDRYGRLFELQHYLRILHERYGESLKGHVEPLECAFASLLSCGDATIHKDLAFVRQQLGPQPDGDTATEAADEPDVPAHRNRIARPR